MTLRPCLVALIIALPLMAQAQDVEQLSAPQERAVEAQQRDVTWYLQHPDERIKLLAQCKDYSDAASDPDCVNAAKATGQDMPPVKE